MNEQKRDELNEVLDVAIKKSQLDKDKKKEKNNLQKKKATGAGPASGDSKREQGQVNETDKLKTEPE